MLEVIFREAPQDRFGVRYAESQRGGELDEFIVSPFNPPFFSSGHLASENRSQQNFRIRPGLASATAMQHES
jgi:hypothetical protein